MRAHEEWTAIELAYIEKELRCAARPFCRRFDHAPMQRAEEWINAGRVRLDGEQVLLGVVHDDGANGEMRFLPAADGARYLLGPAAESPERQFEARKAADAKRAEDERRRQMQEAAERQRQEAEARRREEARQRWHKMPAAARGIARCAHWLSQVQGPRPSITDILLSMAAHVEREPTKLPAGEEPPMDIGRIYASNFGVVARLEEAKRAEEEYQRANAAEAEALAALKAREAEDDDEQGRMALERARAELERSRKPAPVVPDEEEATSAWREFLGKDNVQ